MKLKRNILPPDQLSRDRIVRELDMNFFVEASAGSGKTTVLIDRMAALILKGVPINMISTITFTKAAANEFYKRFHKKLSELLGKTDGKERSWVEDALKNIDLCFMGTIDAFCNMILKEHPSRAGVPSKVKVMQGAEWDGIFLREYKLMLVGAYGSVIQQKAMAFDSLFDYADDTFMRIMEEMMNKSSYEFSTKAAPGPSEVQRKYCTYMPALNDLLKLFESDTVIDKMRSNSDKEKYARMKRAAVTLGELDRIKAASTSGTYLFDHMSELSSAVTAIKGFKFTLTDDVLFNNRPGYFPPSIDGWISRNSTAAKIEAGSNMKTSGATFTIDFGENNELLSMMKELKYDMALDLCAAARGQLFERLRANGELSFSPCLSVVRDMLKRDAACEGSPLIRHITGRHRYYLIDEFQDTDPLQYEIFFYLAAGERAVPEWEKCVPLPGALFIVGDPKQSIYSFKGADVEAFIKVRELFENASGGEDDPRAVLRLTFNFRSTPELCAYFDEQFTGLLGREIYSPIRTAGDEGSLLFPKGEKLFHGCLRLVPPAKDKDEDDPFITTVADIIEAIEGNEEHLIMPDPEAPARKIEYDDIMIITKNKTLTDDFRRELEMRGIPVFVEGSCSFETSRALAALTNVLYAAADPWDSQAVVSALLGPLFGFSEADLAEAGRTKETPEGRFASLMMSEDLDKALGGGSLSEAVKTLRKLGNKARRMSPSAAICMVAEELRIFSVMGSSGMKYYYYALELIRSREAEGTLTSLRQAADMLKKMIEDSDGLERCLTLSENEKGVHIANLHKVKGLEKPVVFLAAGRSTKYKSVREKTEIALVKDAEGRRFPYVFKVSKKIGSNSINIIASPEDREGYDEYFGQAVESGLDEIRRQHYVAATRAGCALIIVDSEKDPESYDSEEQLLQTQWKALIKGSTLISSGNWLAELKPKEGKNGLVSEELGYAESAYTSKDTAAGAKPEHPYVLPSDAAVKPNSYGEDEIPDETEQEEEDTGDGESLIPGNEKGTLVHACMEYLILSRGAAASDPQLLAERVVDEKGSWFDEEQRSEGIEMLKGFIKRMLSGGYSQDTAAPADLFSELCSDRTDEVYCELPFVYTDEEQQIVSGVIDLLYRQGDNWHIIDYKTNRNAVGLEQDPKYAAQLACYAEAVKRLRMQGRGTVDAHIYHIEA